MSFKVTAQVDAVSEGLAEYFSMTPGNLLVLLQLALRANAEAEAWPSIQTISRRTGLSRRQVQLSLRELGRWNLIKPLENAKGGRPGASTKYLIRLDTLAKLEWGFRNMKLADELRRKRVGETGANTSPVGA